MPVTITRIHTHDVRFPTAEGRHGSDAMNPDPDYSAAYCVLETNQPGLEGHGLTFTIGRGNELCVAAIASLAPLVEGRRLDAITADMAQFWRSLAGDSQLRWVGPEKGVIHLATAALVNAVWDLWAKQAGKPLWRMVADMTPEEIVGCIDFRGITDALTPGHALEILKAREGTRAERIAELERSGYPAYTTSVGWLGYDNDTVRARAAEARAAGWTHVKVKVGQDLEADKHRLALLRDAMGPEAVIMTDANQVWEVDQAITWTKALAPFNPYWIEEPVSPDDILGHARIRQAVAPIRVATGEMCQNRIVFKQMFQAGAIDICQLDACRLGGVNEVLAVYLMAERFGIPVCPHAGGVGLCEYVQHLAMIDYVCISGTQNGRVLEYVDHLHDHFVDPVRMRGGRYLVPESPGYSITMKSDSLSYYRFPDGPAWNRA